MHDCLYNDGVIALRRYFKCSVRVGSSVDLQICDFESEYFLLNARLCFSVAVAVIISSSTQLLETEQQRIAFDNDTIPYMTS